MSQLTLSHRALRAALLLTRLLGGTVLLLAGTAAFLVAAPFLLVCYVPRFWAWVQAGRWPRRLAVALVLLFYTPRHSVEPALYDFCYPNLTK